MEFEQRDRAIQYLKSVLLSEGDRLLLELLIGAPAPKTAPADLYSENLPPLVDPEGEREMASWERKLEPGADSIIVKAPRKPFPDRVARDKRFPWQGPVIAAIADGDDQAALSLLRERHPSADSRSLKMMKRWHSPMIEEFKSLPFGEPRMAYLKKEYGYERHNLPLNGMVQR